MNRGLIPNSLAVMEFKGPQFCMEGYFVWHLCFFFLALASGFWLLLASGCIFPWRVYIFVLVFQSGAFPLLFAAFWSQNL